MRTDRDIDGFDYLALAEFRYQIRRFLRFSEEAARAAGIEPQQHQLLLTVKARSGTTPASIGDVAERLQIQHHSTVELVDRLSEQGLVQRRRGTADRRRVMLSLTAKGEKILRELSLHHRKELQASGPELIAALRRLIGRAPAREEGAIETRKPAVAVASAVRKPRARVRKT